MWQNMALFSLYIYPSLYPFLPSFKNMSKCFQSITNIMYLEMNQNMLFIKLQEDKPENITQILKIICADKFKRENKCRDCTFLHSFLTTLWLSQAQWLNLPYKCRLVGWKQSCQSPRSSWILSIPYCTHHRMP